MTILLQDLRYAARLFRKSPAFALITVLILALGIGANTAVFSVSDALLFKLLPVSSPRQLVYFRLVSPEEHGNQFSREEFEAFQHSSQAFAGMFAFDTTRVVVSANGKPDFVWGQSVSGTFFSVLGVRTSLGRALAKEDDQSGNPPVAVISYDYWRRTFGLEPSVLGSTIALKGIPFRVVGVASQLFRGIELGDSIDVWVPLSFWEQLRLNDHLTLGVIARVKPAADMGQASTELTTIDQQLAAAALGSKLSPQLQREIQARRVELVPAGRGLSDLPDQLPQSLRVLAMIAGLVLLIACANIGNLLLARSVGRQKEIAVRLALGASRVRLFRQLLTESLLLALTGGVLGLLFSSWTMSFLLQVLSDQELTRAVDLRTDARTLLFALGTSLFTCLVFATVPAFWATRRDVGLTLKGVPPSSQRHTLGPRKALVISQVSVSVLLLVVAALLVRSLQNLSSVDAGFRQENVLLISVYPTLSGYQGSRELDLYARAQQRVSATPGVLSATFSRFGLLSGGRWIRVPQFTSPENEKQQARVNCNPVAPRFFSTMGIPLILGRDFAAADDQAAPPAAVISQSFAQAYFHGENPLGELVRFKDDKSAKPITVVGVVKDVKALSLWDHDPLPQVYIPLAQAPADLLGQATMEVRASAGADALVTAVRDAMRDVDANLPLVSVITQKAQSEGTLQSERSLSTLSSAFGALALVLASLGLYAIAAFTVASRTREIGIRMAVGARPGEVRSMIIRQGLALAAGGVLLGLVMAVAASRVLASLFFEIRAADSLIYLEVSILLAAVAWAACYLPARRAARVDPMIALRYE